MEKLANHRLNLFAIACSAAALSACGGGGSSGGSAAAPIQNPGATSQTSSRGAITAFGSVVVNGVRYETDSAAFRINGDPGSQDDLFVGQQVVVRGRNNGDGTGRAEEVIFDADLEGPVSTIDLPNNQFTVLGQTVIVSGDTIFDGGAFSTLATGDIVEVSGNLDADGALRALSVEVRDEEPLEFEVEGIIRNLDAAAQTFSINGLTVSYATALIEPGSAVLADGLLVEIEGTGDGQTLTATHVEVEDSDFTGQEGDVGELHGFIQSVESATQFTLSGVKIIHDGLTEFEGGRASELVPNAEVEVEGLINADGALVADFIEIESEGEQDLPVRIQAPVQSTDTTANSLTVLGITVTTNERTRFVDERDNVRPFSLADLVVGDFVELRAYDDGSMLIAGLVERDVDSLRVRLQAELERADAATGQLVIEGVPVDASTAVFRDDEDEQIRAEDFFEMAESGELVRARGTFDGQTLTATEVSFEDAGEHDEDDDENDVGDDEEDEDDRDDEGEDESEDDSDSDDEDGEEEDGDEAEEGDDEGDADEEDDERDDEDGADDEEEADDKGEEDEEDGDEDGEVDDDAEQEDEDDGEGDGEEDENESDDPDAEDDAEDDGESEGDEDADPDQDDPEDEDPA